MGQLANLESIAENLDSDGSTITWRRGGLAPELCSASFEASSDDGITWIDQGAGSRISDGWQLTGVWLDPGTKIRGRGTVISSGKSTWVTETVTSPAVIISQPASLTSYLGTMAVFTVAAGGMPAPTYQWLKDGVPLSDGGNVLGANTAMLMVNDVSSLDAGGYSVVVTNRHDSATSTVATLNVVALPVPSRPVILVHDGAFGVHTNAFSFNVQATAGQGVILEASTNLIDWVAVQTNITTDAGQILFTEPMLGSSNCRFYRVQLE